MSHFKEQLYNEKVKNIFLETLNGRIKRTARILFSYTAPYERLHDKDFFNMDESEIKFVIQETIGVMYVERISLKPYIQIIKLYLKWAFESKFIKLDISSQIGNSLREHRAIYSVDSYLYKFVKDEFEFLKLMDYLFPPAWVNESLTNLRTYTSFLLLFNGIPLDDIGYILKSDVNFDNKTISFIHQADKQRYSVKMIDSFIPKYKSMIKAPLIVKIPNSVKNKKINVNLFLALCNESKDFKSALKEKILREKDRTSVLLKRNKINKKPTILKPEFVIWNGLLYRMYLSITKQTDYCVDIPDMRKSDVSRIFQEYCDIFYNEVY